MKLSSFARSRHGSAVENGSSLRRRSVANGAAGKHAVPLIHTPSCMYLLCSSKTQ